MERFTFICKHYFYYCRINILSGITAIAVDYGLFFVLRYRYYFYGNLLKYLFGNYLLTFLTMAGIETHKRIIENFIYYDSVDVNGNLPCAMRYSLYGRFYPASAITLPILPECAT